ncbi:ssDNA endonuclease and repair protein rad10 [Onygenales sp. PD_10]|nr:ssDNA endonuclease and repair protein rad10 [Onygenales sp. PD_10]
MDDDFGDVPDFDALTGPHTSSRPSAPPAVPATPAQPKVQQPKPQALPGRSGPSAILVSTRQRGNPILNHVRHVPWEYADIPADYVVGSTTCVLFLSLKYYRLHPEYIYSRIKGIGGKYNLRILLIMVDIPDHENSLRELSKTSLVNNLTLILCWSAVEAGHYLELFKSCEHAQPTAIRTQQSQSYKESLVEFITAPRSINKSDATSLMSTFGSLQAAVNAQPEQISTVPGWGERKVQQWCDAVREDFRIRKTAKRSAPPHVNRGKGTERQHEDMAEEEAFLAAHSESISRGSAMGDTPAADSAGDEGRRSRENPSGRSEEELDDGIMAALAKLRDQET